MKTIGVIGLWHLGEVYSACLADMGHAVIGFSDDATLIEGFTKNIPPLAEPALSELLEKNQREGRLIFTTDMTRIAECDVVWITFDVPVDDEDRADVSVVSAAVRTIAPSLRQDVIVAVSSQIPAGTSARIRESIKESRPDLKFGYFYSPENLRLGDAVRGFKEPGRVIVGADSDASLSVAREILAPLNVEIISMSPASAEMAKHALNAWLATSISFTNDLADVAENVGADIEDVIRALKSEPRVGQKAYLFAGLGFSGGTLGRDMQSLLSAARTTGAELPVIDGAYRKNIGRHAIVLERLDQLLSGVKGKKIAIFGVTYKSGTPTLRRSQPLQIEKLLHEAGAHVRLFDPLANADEVRMSTDSELFDEPYEAATDADAVVVLVPDMKLRDLDFLKLASVMRGADLFDAQNILVPKENEIRAAGLSYSSIGR